jgi:TolB-like protein/Tfp pilus assembly protein PilF
MSESPNKLIRFWQELKRRKTGKVVIAYTATAFILLQLADILTPALLLPEWTTRLITLILIIGFPIAVIFSWVFEITPEGIKKTESIEAVRKRKSQPVTVKRRIRASDVIITAMAVVIVILLYPKIFNKDKFKVIKNADGRISIAVTNFDNNTNDTTLNWLRKGIPELIRNNLTFSNELAVQNSQTMFELYESMGQTQTTSIAPSLSREAAIKLKTGTFITGSFQKFGDNILTYIKLIDTKSDELLWSGSIEGKIERYKYLADSIASQVKDYLEIRVLKQKTSQEYDDVNTRSPEALRKYLEGMKLLMQGKYKQAVQSFEESFKIDTTLTLAAFYASYSSSYDNDQITSQKWTRIAYRDRKNLPYDYRIWAELFDAFSITRNGDSVLYYNNLLAKSDSKSRLYWFDVGCTYDNFYRYQESIRAFEKVESISSEWDEDFKIPEYYDYFGRACHEEGLHEKEAKILNIGAKLFPENLWIKVRQFVCAITQSDYKLEVEFTNLLKEWGKRDGYSESDIEYGLGLAYAWAKSLEKAEKHYRKASKLMPNNKYIIANLASFLIENERNLPEGIALIDSMLVTYPGDYGLLLTKGVACYKQGKYNEALEILQKYEGFEEGRVFDGIAYKYLKKTREALSH